MKPTVLWLTVFLALAPALASGVEVTSVHPEVTVSESPVTLIGGPFEAGVRVMLGEVLIEPRILNSRQLVFMVPQLAPGAYALSLVDETAHFEQVFELQVVLPAPMIEALSPESIDECYDPMQHEVTLRGATCNRRRACCLTTWSLLRSG